MSPNITAELSSKGKLIGIEVLNASIYLRDFLMETAQARQLNLNSPEP